MTFIPADGLGLGDLLTGKPAGARPVAPPDGSEPSFTDLLADAAADRREAPVRGTPPRDLDAARIDRARNRDGAGENDVDKRTREPAREQDADRPERAERRRGLRRPARDGRLSRAADAAAQPPFAALVQPQALGLDASQGVDPALKGNSPTAPSPEVLALPAEGATAAEGSADAAPTDASAPAGRSGVTPATPGTPGTAETPTTPATPATPASPPVAEDQPTDSGHVAVPATRAEPATPATPAQPGSVAAAAALETPSRTGDRGADGDPADQAAAEASALFGEAEIRTEPDAARRAEGASVPAWSAATATSASARGTAAVSEVAASARPTVDPAERLITGVVERLRQGPSSIPSLDARFVDPDLGAIRLAVAGDLGDPVRAELVVADPRAAEALARAADRIAASGGLIGIELRIRTEASDSSFGDARQGSTDAAPGHDQSAANARDGRDAGETQGSIADGAQRESRADRPAARARTTTSADSRQAPANNRLWPPSLGRRGGLDLRA